MMSIPHLDVELAVVEVAQPVDFLSLLFPALLLCSCSSRRHFCAICSSRHCCCATVQCNLFFSSLLCSLFFSSLFFCNLLFLPVFLCKLLLSSLSLCSLFFSSLLLRNSLSSIDVVNPFQTLCALGSKKKKKKQCWKDASKDRV